MQPMLGHLAIGSATIAHGGFLMGAIPECGFGSSAAISRGEIAQALAENANQFGEIARGEITGDLQQIASQMDVTLKDIQRALTSADVPVRENLEAPAISLIPEDTPLRNLLPRTTGSGRASLWQQLTSLGGGFGGTYDQPGGGTAAQMFYSESGAPAEFSSVYAQKSAAYKLIGAFGKVTGFAMAAGANYQDQMARERINALKNLMLNEENALTRGDATATAAPWGDGVTALAFNGLYNLVTTANGVPSSSVATAVGALTKAHIDAQLTRIWIQGGRGLWMHMNAQEIQSLTHLVEASGSILRMGIQAQDGVVLGFKVSGYVHPVSGEEVKILASRFASPGTIIFGAKYGPDGSAALDVEVLPQVPVPNAPESPQQIQGYTVTELARTLTAPDVHPFMASVYETPRMKNAKVFAKSTGVTAV